MNEYENVTKKVEKAKETLKEHGYTCKVLAEELIRWFETDTIVDDIGLDEVLKEPFLVIHELVEIGEVNRMGLKITKDVIIKNPEKIERAHLKAAEVEFEIAEKLGDYNHLEKRLKHVKAWCNDPTVPPEYKEKYRELYNKTERIINDCKEK
jgi:hypothetical protein